MSAATLPLQPAPLADRSPSVEGRKRDASGVRAIHYAMQCPDELVVELVYTDSNGARTRRVVSPIRFVGRDRFLGLCLCRCEPRQFQIGRCDQVRLRRAADYVMPVPIETA